MATNSPNSAESSGLRTRAQLLPLLSGLGDADEYRRFVSFSALIEAKDSLAAVGTEILAIARDLKHRGREDALHLLQWVPYSAVGDQLIAVLFEAIRSPSVWQRKRAFVAIAAHSDFPRAPLNPFWNPEVIPSGVGGPGERPRAYLEFVKGQTDIAADEAYQSLRPFVAAGLMSVEQLLALLTSEERASWVSTIAELLTACPERAALIDKMRPVFSNAQPEGQAATAGGDNTGVHDRARRNLCRAAGVLNAIELRSVLFEACIDAKAQGWQGAALEALRMIGICDAELTQLLQNWRSLAEPLQSDALRVIDLSLSNLSPDSRAGLKKVLLVMLTARPRSDVVDRIHIIISKL